MIPSSDCDVDVDGSNATESDIQTSVPIEAVAVEVVLSPSIST